MEHIRKYAIAYIFLALVIGIAIAQLPWKNWFGKPAEVADCKTPDGKDGKKDATGNCVAISERRATRREPILDANGNPTGRYTEWCWTAVKGGSPKWVEC